MTLAHELGSRRAPGAGRAAGPAAGADAADAGGDGLRVRRDADLQGAARHETSDASERKALMAQKVEDMINTVVRQIAFYTFERKVHEERAAGRADVRPARRTSGSRCRPKAWARPSS